MCPATGPPMLPRPMKPTVSISAPAGDYDVSVYRRTSIRVSTRVPNSLPRRRDEAGKGQSSYDSRGVSAEYQSSQFIYDAQTNSHLCPQGKILSYEGKEQRHLQVSYRYRAKRSDCEECPMRSQCCPGNRVTGRSVHRSEELAQVAEVRQKMQSERARAIYKTRAQVAETPNLWIKAKFGLRQFSVRGLIKVGMEALWACLTYNIRVWVRLWWRRVAVV